jgi:hypothetical protein
VGQSRRQRSGGYFRGERIGIHNGVKSKFAVSKNLKLENLTRQPGTKKPLQMNEAVNQKSKTKYASQND